MSKAAVQRLLRFTTKYQINLKKDSSVTPGTLNVAMHPSDYDKEGGNLMQVEVFDVLSKTNLLADVSGNLAAFLSRCKTDGFKAAVEGVKLKYDLPGVPTNTVRLKRIEADISKIKEHLGIGVGVGVSASAADADAKKKNNVGAVGAKGDAVDDGGKTKDPEEVKNAAEDNGDDNGSESDNE